MMKLKVNKDDIWGIVFFCVICILTFIAIKCNLIPSCIIGVTSIICIISLFSTLIILLRNLRFNNIIKLIIIIVLTFLLTMYLGDNNNLSLNYIITLVVSIVIIYFIIKVSKPIVNFLILVFCFFPYALLIFIIEKFNVNCNLLIVFIAYILVIRYIYPKICKKVNNELFKAHYNNDELREFYKLVNIIFSTLLLFQYSNELTTYDKSTVLLLVFYLVFDIKWEIFMNK